MSVAGLDWQTVQFSLVGGLDTKTQGQALDPPGLSSCKNVEFDEVGGLRLRKPYASIGSNIYPSGALSSVRKIVVVGDELLAFTATTLYSWSETLTAWVSKGAHLAVAVTEATQFGNPSDQVFADRAQLSGVVVIVWTEVLSTTLAYLAAYDATTGAVLVDPTSFGAGLTRPRVTALSTKILVTWMSGVSLFAKALSPSAPSFTASGGTSLTAGVPLSYDIVKDPAADQAVYVARITGSASYEVGVVTASMTVPVNATKAQTCDGPIAVACTPAGAAVARVFVLRAISSFAIKADAITLSTLADFSMNVAIGTAGGAVNQITGAFRTVANSGEYRCYVFWHSLETSGVGGFNMELNWIDTNIAVGTENDTFLWYHAVASRAFDYNGSVYLWTVFAGESQASGLSSTTIGLRAQFQNTYTLYDDAGTLVTKATWSRAGGFGYYTGHLAGVALVSGTTGYAWAGTERQIVEIGGGDDRTSYSARAPRDIGFTFDSDDARRVAVIGRTAYVSGGMLLQYDGAGLTEVGFTEYPWYITVAGAGGAIPAGTYSYKITLRWDNARGETERSTTAIGDQVTLAAAASVVVTASGLTASRKQGAFRYPTFEMWRTVVNPATDSPFYLITSKDPSTIGANNGYVVATVNVGSMGTIDNFSDATLTTKEQSPENGNVLPRLAPPGAAILIADGSRMFIAGVPGDLYAVHYSLLRNEGEIVGFNSVLRFTIPATTGAITGLAFQGDTLVVFTASAIYIVGGAGYDNTGGGSNYGPPQLVTSDVGALSHDTIATTPSGLIFFSRKGWYRLSPGWDLEYIGAKVEGYNTDTWIAAQVVESQHQVRFLSSSRMLMFDYLVGEWSEWTQSGGKALARWRTHPMLLDTAVKKEQSTFAAADYTYEVVSGWFKPAQMQGMARVRRAMVLGEFKADHAQSISVGYDYLSTYTDGASHPFTGLTVGNPTQLRLGPSRQRCEAIRVKVSVTVSGTDCVVLTGLAFEVGIRRGLYARLPAAQKQ